MPPPSVLALHGFLGQGSDWDLLAGPQWHCPSFFHPSSEYPLQSFAEFAGFLNGRAVNDQGCRTLVGYSLGGRLALMSFLADPERWDQVVLLSTHLGLADSKSQSERRTNDQLWAERFASARDWSDLIAEWNSQEVFSGDSALPRRAEHYDRSRLALALQNLSLGNQPLITELGDRLQSSKLRFLVGEKDEKFLRLYEGWRSDGLIHSFQTVKNGGHRLLFHGDCNIASL